MIQTASPTLHLLILYFDQKGESSYRSMIGKR